MLNAEWPWHRFGVTGVYSSVLMMTGLSINVLGPVGPVLMRHLSASPHSIGSIYSAEGLGNFLGSLLLGPVLSRLRPHAVLVGVSALVFLCLGAVPSCSALHQVASLYLLIGLASGLGNATANTSLTWAWHGAAPQLAAAFNLVNSCFPLGGAPLPRRFHRRTAAHPLARRRLEPRSSPSRPLPSSAAKGGGHMGGHPPGRGTLPAEAPSRLTASPPPSRLTASAASPPRLLPAGSAAPLVVLASERRVGNSLAAFSAISVAALLPAAGCALLQPPTAPPPPPEERAEEEKEGAADGSSRAVGGSTVLGIDLGSRRAYVRCTVHAPLLLTTTLCIGAEIAYAAWVYAYAAHHAEMRSDEARGSRDAAEMQPRCSRGAAEVQPRCSRGAAEVQPRCDPTRWSLVAARVGERTDSPAPPPLRLRISPPSIGPLSSSAGSAPLRSPPTSPRAPSSSPPSPSRRDVSSTPPRHLLDTS